MIVRVEKIFKQIEKAKRRTYKDNYVRKLCNTIVTAEVDKIVEKSKRKIERVNEDGEQQINGAELFEIKIQQKFTKV